MRKRQIIICGLSGSKYFPLYHINGPCKVGPCHHDITRPQVADGETASNMEGSCEYIE